MALPRTPPATAPVATPSPATSAARRVSQPPRGAVSRAWAIRLRNAGCMRCTPWPAATSRAAAVIASFSSASPPRSLRRRPRSRSPTIRSTRFSGPSPIEAHLRRGAQRAQLHHLDRPDRGPHLCGYLFEGVPVQETELEHAAVVVGKAVQDPACPLRGLFGWRSGRYCHGEVLMELRLRQPQP